MSAALAEPLADRLAEAETNATARERDRLGALDDLAAAETAERSALEVLDRAKQLAADAAASSADATTV